MHLKSLWQKFVPDWKLFLQRCLPYVLIMVLSLAMFFSVITQKTEEQELANINAAKAELEIQKQQVATQKQELSAAMAQAQALMGQLQTANTDTQALLQQAETQNGQIDDKINNMNAAYEKIEDKERQQWVLPMRYKLCTSSYGYREHPVEGEGKFHQGVDLAAARGTPIVAARSGTVEIAEYLEDNAGYWVLIDHMDGYESAYMHMDRYIVTQGQFVVAGQIIGYCGSSGIATGDHLHFEIRKDNQVVNPADYIDMY